MDLLKYLEPMKNLPERFSNLAFWRGVRKLKDEVVSAFEYVDSWGKHIESQLDNIPYHNEFPYIYVKNNTVVPVQFKANVTYEKHRFESTDVIDSYIVPINGIIAPSMPKIKNENYYINSIFLYVYLHNPDSTDIYKQWCVHTNTAISNVNLDADGNILSFNMMPSTEIFTLSGIDADIASGKVMSVELAFNVLWKRS